MGVVGPSANGFLRSVPSHGATVGSLPRRYYLEDGRFLLLCSIMSLSRMSLYCIENGGALPANNKRGVILSKCVFLMVAMGLNLESSEPFVDGV